MRCVDCSLRADGLISPFCLCLARSMSLVCAVGIQPTAQPNKAIGASARGTTQKPMAETVTRKFLANHSIILPQHEKAIGRGINRGRVPD